MRGRAHLARLRLRRSSDPSTLRAAAWAMLLPRSCIEPYFSLLSFSLARAGRWYLHRSPRP